MSNRNLLILGLTAAVTATLAVVLSGISGRPYAPANAPRDLIQGLDPDQIASITIGRGNEQVILSWQARTITRR